MADTRFDWRDLLSDALERACRYGESLPERPVTPAMHAVAEVEAWAAGTSLPERGATDREVLAELDARVTPATVATAGPRYFGFVVGGSLPACLAASWLADAWDQNAGMRAMSPGAVALDRLVGRWLLCLLGLPADSTVSLTTGATLANFSALAAARHRVLARAGWDVEADGLFGAPAVTVLVGAEAHPSVLKGLGLLGLGRRRVVRVAADRQGRMRPEALPDVAGPAILCAQAGNVNSGAFDPFPALRDWCDARNAWLHVDGAFGLWAQASPQLAGLTRGVERADSWATDGHKWLNVPYDCGVAIVRDADALVPAMSIDAPYLGGEASAPARRGPEASQRARAVGVFAAIRSLGRQGVAALIERHCAQARRFAEGLAAAGVEVLNDVVLNQVVASFGDAAANAAVLDRIERAGVCWCGPTRWQGRDAMRISVSGWATTDDDVERSLASILACADEVRGETRGQPPAARASDGPAA